MKFEHTEVFNFEGAVRGMRNSMNSWDKSDSGYCGKQICPSCSLSAKGCRNSSEIKGGNNFTIGKKDLELMQKLIKEGSVVLKN